MSNSELKQNLRGLADWFQRQKRVLPWRDQPTPYRVWISEIMLQQTQVATVVPYFERFVARFPDVESLARAELDEVLQAWAGLGYYSRARNLHAAARQIVERGGFPEAREEWLELPGVGPYTSGAIVSIAYDAVAPILDGNVERVMSRLRRVNRRGGDAQYKERLWRLARLFVARGAACGVRPSVLNQALMELGATVCTPRSPSCLLCPLSAICRGRQAGDAQAFPPAKAPKRWVNVREELHCWLDDRGRVLLRLRQQGEWRAGLWDLPTEAPPRKGSRLLGSVETRHVVTRHKITRVTTVWKTSAPLRAAEEGSAPARWVGIEEPGEKLAVGSALLKTLRQVRELPGLS